MMTIELLKQVIEKQVEIFKDNYGYDYWWILDSLQESILEEYDKQRLKEVY